MAPRPIATDSGTSPSQSEEERAFLQRRVALFGLVGGSIGAAFWLFRFAFVIAGASGVNGSLWAHLFAVLVLLGIWLVARRGAHSVATLRTLESAGFVLSSFGYLGMVAYIELLARPDMIVVLALTIAATARAVWVPSTATRTAVLSAVIALPLVVGTFLRLDLASAEEAAVFVVGNEASQRAVALVFASFTAAWWLATSVLATLTTKTLFGLRRQARNVRRLGQYHLEEKLGEGGMGIVFRARHAMLRRPTAIKILPPSKLGGNSIERFEREVQQTARLSHPNTVTIYDYGRTPDGLFYYAMELLDGADLSRIVEAVGPMPDGRVRNILVAACSSLAEAHEAGLIHRDVKPSNILLCRQGGEEDVAKLVDFGLAKQVASTEVTRSLSTADTLTGTPSYMAPEAIRSANGADARSDLYALGAVGYYLLTGTSVFEGNLLEVCGHHLFTEPDPISERVTGEVAIDAELERVVMSCLAKDPAARPQSARELRERLLGCEEVIPWPQDAAESWWTNHRDELSRVAGDGKVSDKTLAVDLARRS